MGHNGEEKTGKVSKTEEQGRGEGGEKEGRSTEEAGTAPTQAMGRKHRRKHLHFITCANENEKIAMEWGRAIEIGKEDKVGEGATNLSRLKVHFVVVEPPFLPLTLPRHSAHGVSKALGSSRLGEEVGYNYQVA